MPVDHYENFPVASLLLPRKLRSPVEAIYRFARSADDIADEGDSAPAHRLAQLAAYREALAACHQGRPVAPALAPIFHPLGEAIRQWRLPVALLGDLLSAFEQDIGKTRYGSYDELLDYCRLSANPVGRLMLHLFDHRGEREDEWSDAICTGLQLANHWQDVAVDWAKDRVYLPQDELAAHGFSDATLAQLCEAAPSGDLAVRWRAFMAFQTARVGGLFQRGRPLIPCLTGRVRWEIALTVAGGERILHRIDARNGDVFRHRPRLGAGDWLPILLGTLLGTLRPIRPNTLPSSSRP